MFETVDTPKRAVMVTGGAGAGKTRFASTAPEPRYLIGTEGGHNQITAAETDPGVQAVVIEGDLANRPSQNWFSTGEGKWPAFEAAVEEVQKMEPGTVIVDSASDLQAMAISQMNIDWSRGDDAFPPMLYGSIYGMLEDAVSALRRIHNVVLTVKTKEEYRTKETIPDVWRKAPYLVESKIWVEPYSRSRGGKAPPHGYPPMLRLGHVSKGKLEGLTLVNPTWNKLMRSTRERAQKELALLQTSERIEKGLRMLGGDYASGRPQKSDYEHLEDFLGAKKKFLAGLIQAQRQQQGAPQQSAPQQGAPQQSAPQQ